MRKNGTSVIVYRFGAFEYDPDADELRKQGRRLRLNGQPLQLLEILLSHAGQIVGREQLRNEFWADDTYVDFDRSLNTAASRLRHALGDSAHAPRFIETIPRKGYRFLASVEQVGTLAEEPPLVHTAIGSAAAGGKRSVSRWERLLWISIAVVPVVVLFLHLKEPHSQLPLRKFRFVPSHGLQISPYNTDTAISPNGRYIAYNSLGQHGIYVLRLDQTEPELLDGTEKASNPFWSPKSDFLAFVTVDQLKKVPVSGGAVTRICDLPGAPRNWGGAWSPDGESIVLSAGNPPALYEIPSRGGTPRLLSPVNHSNGESVNSAAGIWRPRFLPDPGRRVLLFAYGNRSAPTMVVYDLESGQGRVLGKGALPVYSAGHLIYQADGFTYTLMAQPFAIDVLELSGRPFRLVASGRDPTVGADNTLLYVDGQPGSRTNLVWLDRKGNVASIVSQDATENQFMELSPDGTRVALAGAVGGASSGVLWVYQMDRRIRTRINNGPDADAAVTSSAWSPDGRLLAFTADGDQSGGRRILIRRADGVGVPEQTPAPRRALLCDWSPDGKRLFYQVRNPTQQLDLWFLERGRSGAWEPQPFLRSSFNEGAAQISPDGKWVAYVSDESGNFEVYVRSLTAGGKLLRVSTNGGSQPRWGADGREIFYAEGRSLMAVPVSMQAEPEIRSAPQRLFQQAVLETDQLPQYDVSPDGTRFLFAVTMGGDVSPSIRMVQNWPAEFR